MPVSNTTPLEIAMITFEVNDMTCGHCVSNITKALKATDKDAKVAIDLASHRVQVEPASAAATPSSQAGASCCGGCH